LLFQIALQIDRVVAEIGARLALGQLHRLGQFALAARDLHALAAAAGRRLDQNRIADRPGRRRSRVIAIDHAVRSAHNRQIEPGDGLFGRHLVAHDPHVLGRGTDEDDAVLGHHLREARVFRKEADAGVDCVRPGDFGRRQQRRGVEVAFARRRRADAYALVRQPHMHGVGVGRRMHGDRGDAHVVAGAMNPERDFAPVGDENLVEHPAGSPIRRSSGVRHTRPAGRRRSAPA
jgi:hypothetical protein